MDLVAAKKLVSDALPDDEQAAWHLAQRHTKAIDLLGHITIVENLQTEIGLVPAADRAQIQDAIDESTAAVAVLSRIIEAHSEKIPVELAPAAEPAGK